QLLQRDYTGKKMGGLSYGISSIGGLALSGLAAKGDLLASFEEMRRRRNLDVFACVIRYQEAGQTKRELLVYAAPDQRELRDRLIEFLMKDDAGRKYPLALKGRPIELPGLQDPRLAYLSMSPLIKRKILEPEFQAFFRSAAAA